MTNKIENNSLHDRAEALVSHIGLTVLSAAAILTVVELDHARAKALPPHSPNTVAGQAAEHGAGEHPQHMRKDKEEIRHMTHSYGVMMRSHPTAGAV
jgi:hypothetical protein